MVFSEKCTVLWYSRFTYSGYFSSSQQPDLFDTKSTNVKSLYARSAYVGENFAKDTCAGGAFITGVCTESIFTRRACIRKAWIEDISVGSTCAKFAIFT